MAIGEPSCSTMLINNLDVGNPLHVQNSDSSSFVLIPFKLLSIENYRIWSSAMKLSLQARNKSGFVDGSCLKESYATNVYMGMVYSKNAASIWKELNETYDKVECTCEVKCSCDADKELQLNQQLMKLMQFLMGLDGCYQPVRSAILTRDNLPEVKDAYTAVSREESYQGIHECSGVTESKMNATYFATKSFNTNRIRHTIEKCFELIGYPPSFKKVCNTVKQNFNANIDVKANDKQQSAACNTPSSFFTDQMRKLLNQIIDVPSRSIHANMIGLKKGDNLGTGSKYGGLYLFDMDNNKSIGNINMVMSFNVSKDLWHNRLGHPADQVLYVLKSNLSLSKNTKATLFTLKCPYDEERASSIEEGRVPLRTDIAQMQTSKVDPTT
ncbi:ribonuclease H-like domain-containing protein [Tanacetum coccineum]